MKQLRKSYSMSLVLALAMLGSMVFSNHAANARVADASAAKPVAPKGGEQVTSGTIVVTPSNMAGWRWMEEDSAAGGGMLVTGPAVPPVGTGSARLSVDSSGRFIMSNLAYAGTQLDAITTLNYSSYSEGASTILAPSLNFDIDYNLTDANTAWQGRLVFEPYQDGSIITPGNWQTWSPMSGKWWASNAAGAPCLQATPCTWGQVLAAFPNAGLRANDGWLHFRVGQWAGGFTGYVDKFVFGVTGNVTTYDFERPAGTLVVGSGAGDVPGATYTTINAAITAAVAGDTIQICPGTYRENVNVNKNGLTLVGAGASANPTYGTVIDGSTAPALGNVPGINLPGGVTGVTIRNLRVQSFASSSGILSGPNNNNFTVDTVTVDSNNATGASGAGIFMSGPVSYVTINNVIAINNKSRGIVIWDGFKQHITITNNIAANNNCCGIELQDGTASGVTMTGNTIVNNTDSGMAATGLTSGAGPNLIANNNITTAGRFGLEIKLPNGTGLESGDGSIVISGNTISRTGPATDLRDYAGIAVIRRGWVAGNNNVDIPTGVVVKNNTVSGFVQPSSSEGFGIVVESLNTKVYSNTLNGNDVGIQRQAGHLPYTANTIVDGDQSNVVDTYFGRGNSPTVCAQLGTNSFSGNGTNTRDVGPVNPPPCNNGAFAHFTPAGPITVTAGSTFNLDLLINGNGHAVRSQQSYMTFPTTLLQGTVTPDTTSLGTVLQNQICNTPTPCTFGALTAPGGSIAYASGSNIGSPAPTGDFRVAQVGFSANQVGTATIHWQFSPPDPANRNSQINDSSNVVVSDPLLYQDYVINIVHATFTGHVIWQGRPQPSAASSMPITLTLISGASVYTFTSTTDNNGNFTVNVDNVPDGNYTWRVKGVQTLSTIGNVALSHAVNTFVEMGTQPTGDANNDNLVNVNDYGILFANFGCGPCGDLRADFNGDNLVNSNDFALLAGNFGRIGDQSVGAPSVQKSGNAVLELRMQGKPLTRGATVHLGDTVVLELWANASPGTNVTAQQSYLTFPSNQLRVGTKPGSTDSKGLVVADNSVLEATLQNGVCNGIAACLFNGVSVPAGSISFASGTFNPAGGTGAFKVGSVTVQATSTGTALLHWQFSPNAPANRNTNVVSSTGTNISQPGQFLDFELKVIASGK